MAKTNLEQMDARSQSLINLAMAMGWMDKPINGMFSDLTKADTVLTIFYQDGTKKLMPWSQYKEDALNLMLDTM